MKMKIYLLNKVLPLILFFFFFLSAVLVDLCTV